MHTPMSAVYYNTAAERRSNTAVELELKYCSSHTGRHTAAVRLVHDFVPSIDHLSV